MGGMCRSESNNRPDTKRHRILSSCHLVLFHHASCARASANDPKLSDGRGWRGPCLAGGKAAAEARAVTAAPVRCSAWLGVDVRFGVGPEVCGTARMRSERRVARKPKLVAEQAVEIPHALQASPAEAPLKSARAKRVKRGLTPASRLTLELECFIARDG